MEELSISAKQLVEVWGLIYLCCPRVIINMDAMRSQTTVLEPIYLQVLQNQSLASKIQKLYLITLQSRARDREKSETFNNYWETGWSLSPNFFKLSPYIVMIYKLTINVDIVKA